MNFAQKITIASGGMLDTPNTDREEAMQERIMSVEDDLLGLRAEDVITENSTMHEKETSALSGALERLGWEDEALYFLSLGDVIEYARDTESGETVWRIVALTRRLAEEIVQSENVNA